MIPATDYPFQQAFIVPVLVEELEAISSRSKGEAQKLLETILVSNEASDKVSKVLEMSKKAK